MKRRLALVLLVTASLVAVPARAQAKLLPDPEWTPVDPVRLGPELAKPVFRGSDVTIGLGMLTLLAGLASVTAGFALANEGHWEYWLSLTILVPVVTTTLGTVLVVTGNSARSAEMEDARLALERERQALEAQRAALLRARVFPPRDEGACTEEVPPSQVAAPSEPGTAPSAPPLVPAGGPTRKPLRPKTP